MDKKIIEIATKLMDEIDMDRFEEICKNKEYYKVDWKRNDNDFQIFGQFVTNQYYKDICRNKEERGCILKIVDFEYNLIGYFYINSITENDGNFTSISIQDLDVKELANIAKTIVDNIVKYLPPYEEKQGISI